MSMDTDTAQDIIKPVDPFVVNSFPPADNILTDAPSKATTATMDKAPEYTPAHAEVEEPATVVPAEANTVEVDESDEDFDEDDEDLDDEDDLDEI